MNRLWRRFFSMCPLTPRYELYFRLFRAYDLTWSLNFWIIRCNFSYLLRCHDSLTRLISGDIHNSDGLLEWHRWWLWGPDPGLPVETVLPIHKGRFWEVNCRKNLVQWVVSSEITDDSCDSFIFERPRVAISSVLLKSESLSLHNAAAVLILEFVVVPGITLWTLWSLS